MGKRMSKTATADDFNKDETKETVNEATGALNPPAEPLPDENTSLIIATKSEIEKHLKALDTAVKSAEKTFFSIGLNLYWFYTTGAYCEINGKGYDNIADFAKERYGIKKATTYQFLKVYERFGKLDSNGVVVGLDDRYGGYNSTSLIIMTQMSDETIEKCNNKMKTKDLKALLKAEQSTDDEDEENDNVASSTSSDDADSTEKEATAETEKNTSSTLSLYHFTSVEEFDEKSGEILTAIKKVLSQKDGHSYSVSITMSY